MNMLKSFLTMHIRGCFYEILFVLLPYTILVIFIAANYSSEQSKPRRMTEFQMSRQDRNSTASTYAINKASLDNSDTLEGISSSSSSPIVDGTTVAQFEESIQLPSAVDFLPHLTDAASLQPSYIESKHRRGVSIVIGIPTVKREKKSYLIETIDNIISNMDEIEQNDTMIVVYVGEQDLANVKIIAQQIRLRFGSFIDSGFLEIIAPSSSYYPDMNNLRRTLDDPLERLRWRSKQNLDFAFLMAYARAIGTFYLQLEDDIITKKGFVTTMKTFALEKTLNSTSSHWFALDFCQLGFIGKMFKSADLPWLISFFQMFYSDQPVDWLLSYVLNIKTCGLGESSKICAKRLAEVNIRYEPSLFQHVGIHSSLPGKVQKLKDEKFGEIPKFTPHHNPPAEVRSSIQPHQSYTIEKAYAGENFFWGLSPKRDDLIEFRFKQPATVHKYLFRSGSLEQPSDRFYNTTVEVLPVDADRLKGSAGVAYNVTKDGFLVVGSFNSIGIAEGVIDSQVSELKELRLHVHSDMKNWVVLREIHLQSNSVL
ncbi:alpha-1,3-mannosyl-glycoprotein 4-beta-N-acetylglucosaminyltransferase A-like [Anopheles albimanus]|uniref:alpha-1,3-mannosyl-glycoprotein 4-beta-N-acetylglucosaminyltransferase A-like n=1 Tax=Anopheles albimanus TaxID=7167 RepID=UPI00164141E8|nr:alpha-1,3-mannosyl-glycoprotein 4-beta-N-acetylglucosaminyltransferase A-like [Anopheles albimanus]